MQEGRPGGRTRDDGFGGQGGLLGSQLGLGGKGWFLRGGGGPRLWHQGRSGWASAWASIGLGSLNQIMGLRVRDPPRTWRWGSGWWAWVLRSGWGSGIRLGSGVKARGLWAEPISRAELDS